MSRPAPLLRPRRFLRSPHRSSDGVDISIYGDKSYNSTLNVYGTLNATSGDITAGNDYSYGVYVYSTADARINANSGSRIIAHASMDDENYRYGISLTSSSASAVMNVEGSSIDACGSTFGIDIYSRGNGAATVLTLKDSALSTKSSAVLSDSAGVSMFSESGKVTMTMNGGTLDASGCSSGLCLYSYPAATLTVNSGTLMADYTNVLPAGDGNWLIYGGENASVQGNITLTHDITITNSLTIPEGAMLTIPEGRSLTLSTGTTLTNNGTLKIYDEGSLEGDGALAGGGKFLTVDCSDEPTLLLPTNATGTGTDYAGRVSVSSNSTVMGQKFELSDYTIALTKNGEKVTSAVELGTYTVTLTYGGGKTVSGSFTIFESTVIPPATGGTTGGTTGGSQTVTNNPDGSTTTTETKPDGTVTETTTDKDGNKTEFVGSASGAGTTTVTQVNGSNSVTVSDENGNVKSEVTLSATAVEQAHQSGAAAALPMPTVTATTDHTTAPTVTVTLPVEEKVVVEIPVENATAGTVAVLVSDDGTETIIKTSVPTGSGIAVSVSNGDTVKIVDNSRTFTDVSNEHWASDAVAFVSSRELLSGTSESSFSPNTDVTRAMVVTVLARLDGVDTSTGDTWYAAGAEWAVTNGISDGTNLSLRITREQLVTMLWRYLGMPESTGDLSGFSDAADVSDYAASAMRWAVETGIITGLDDGSIDPQGYATRAQFATMLMRFMQNI